jgi:hypothetical protein
MSIKQTRLTAFVTISLLGASVTLARLSTPLSDLTARCAAILSHFKWTIPTMSCTRSHG